MRSIASLNGGFWGPFAAGMAGSAAGVTVAKKNKRYEIQKRRRGVIPRGNPSAFWRKVYGAVERLWNDMGAGDKASWLYGGCPRGLTPRDYFGRWNMNLVGRWSRWVRMRPAGMQYRSRKTDYPGAEAVPADIDACLFGHWMNYSMNCPAWASEFRGATGTGGNVAAAWAAAWGALLGKKWTAMSGWVGHNYGFVGGYGASYTGYAFQGRCRLRVAGGECYAWRNQHLRLTNGYPAGGAVDLQWALGGRYFGPEKRLLDWPDIWATGPGTVWNPPLEDVGNWAAPPAPVARYVYKGWYIASCVLSYEGRL